MIDINELRRKLHSGDIVDHIDIHANVKPVLTEILDRLEAAEKDIALKERIIDSLGSTLNAVSNERDVLRDRLALESQENGALRDSVDRACEERDALLARIEAMERQEPVAIQHRVPSVDFRGECVGYSEWRDGTGLEHWPRRTLYAIPGAQPAPIIPEGWKLVRVSSLPNGRSRESLSKRLLRSASDQCLPTCPLIWFTSGCVLGTGT